MRGRDSLNIFRPKSPGMRILSRGGSQSWASYWASSEGVALKNKMLLWTSKDDEKSSYYVNKIGVQEREAVTEGGVAGIIHPGRAICYDGAKNQYSRTIGNMPSNFRLATNSITLFGRIRVITSPSANTLVAGYIPDSINGVYSIQVTNTGALMASIRHSAGVISKISGNVCDGLEHTFFMCVNKAGYFAFYVDNILIQGLTDISALTFGDYATPFYVGGTTGFFSGIKYLRDLRIWSSAITSQIDRDVIHKGDYVAGCTSWWFCEEGKESNAYPLKDSIGTNHLYNLAFDSTSLVSGSWASLLNKFGYSQTIYSGGDLILGDGTFSDPALWDFTATRFAVTGGQAWFKAVDNLSPNLKCKRAITYTTADVLKISFDITSGTAKISAFTNQNVSFVILGGTFGVGHHDIICRPSLAGTAIGITGDYTGGAFYMDNFTIEKYEAGIIAPLMNTAIPTTDTYGRNLTFKDQAKLNLQKVDEDTVNLPDYVGELFDAGELITVNDWYDAAGVGNEIDLANIEAYQTGKQFYKAINEELIIIKATESLTSTEEVLLKRYCNSTGESYTEIYNVDVAIGAITGTTAQIYAMAQAVIDSGPVSAVQAISPVPSDLDPTKNYLAMGWSDFFITDQLYTLPLITKYGFANSFHREIVPLSNDYRNSDTFDRNKVKMIERSGSYDSEHSMFSHMSYISNHPLFDGRITPSNDDIRVERSDGLNAFGYDGDATVDSSITTNIREQWLKLSATLGAKTWKDLTDADCIAFRKSLAVFTVPTDQQNGELVLQSLDLLSARYCGTVGQSVYDDYTTRTPNTIDGLAPSPSNPIIGGIFQGATTTCNHEIWERLLTITRDYKLEFEGKIKSTLHYSSSGGANYETQYIKEGDVASGINYQDRECTKLASGASKHTSSITGTTRSFLDVLRTFGFISSMAVQGDGYSDLPHDDLTRLEAQRIFKKNGLKKSDNVGDGFRWMLRGWNPNLTIAEQNTLLASEDVVKELYDLCFPKAGNEYLPGAYFDHILNALVKFNAWGLVPDMVDDSMTTGDGISSYILALEALFQFCKRAGIAVISHEEAALMGKTKILPAGYNYFPNNLMATTVKTVTNAVNAVLYPDGWNGGVILSEDTGNGAVNVLHKDTDGTIFTRQYAIKTGTFNLSFKAKGVGVLKIRKILNSDTYNTNSGAAFTEINSITINSPAEYTSYSDTVVIPDAALENYSAPTTPKEEAYQNYMKGYGNKICGIQIELIITGGNSVKMGNCNLTALQD